MKSLNGNSFYCFLLGFFLLMLPFANVAAFVDPPTFSPAQPYAGQPIEMSVRAGHCHGFVAPPPGYPFLDVAVNDDAVDVVISGVQNSGAYCHFAGGSISVDIGSLPQGIYTVRVSIRNANPPYNVIPTTSEAVLTVMAPYAPVMVPSTSKTTLLIFSGVIALLAVWVLGRKPRNIAGLCAFAFFLMHADAYAQGSPSRIYVELSRGNGAPTPEQIVNNFSVGSGLPPPISALSVESPRLYEFFIPRGNRARGEFKQYLDENPDLPRSRLEQTIVVKYPEGADLNLALSSLLADPRVRHANIAMPLRIAGWAGDMGQVAASAEKSTASQYWITAMNFQGAWGRAGGWAHVGVIDNGLYVDHPDLVSQDSNGALTGGNFISSAAFDISLNSEEEIENLVVNDYNVDEMEATEITDPWSAACDPQGTGFLVPSIAGHGSHVHGLIAANHENSDGVVGACKNCSMSTIKVLYSRCIINEGKVYQEVNEAAVWAALSVLADTGSQVINISLGGDGFLQQHCSLSAYWDNAECKAIANAKSKGVLVVASSGNNRGKIEFPASDPRVVSVGGVDETLDFWNEDKDPPPNHLDGCPYYAEWGSEQECGSNYTMNVATDAKQDHVAPARRVLSTLYPGKEWNSVILCDDAALGVNGDGKGPCTGTSMSAPIVSGLAGILRSINPLVLPGEATTSGPYRGIRSVMIESSRLPSPTETWNPKLGYGIINANAAVSAMLGSSNGKAMKNRVTPLFSFYGASAKDWAYTTVPQSALSFIANNSGSYQPQGLLTPGYASFPYEYPAPPPPAPRASAYVLTTEFKTDASHPDLVPLYWLDRSRPWPLGCTPGVPGCNGNNRDFIFLTSAAHVQVASNAGYQYRGREGYVYQACTPEPACIPQGAERLWLKCKVADDDCAVFLERERAAFEAQGYTSAYPAGSNMLLGYAYPNVDSDGDGLIDGLEYLLGSKPNQIDSDGDGIPDGVEYPQAGVPVSDPCSGSRCNPDYLFDDGFE